MPFTIQQEQLIDIALSLAAKIREGLAHDDQEIACLPSYISVRQVPQHGRALVMDFGGSNVRAALVSLHEGRLQIEKGPVAQAIPLKRGVPLEREKFLAHFCELIASFEPPQDLPLGYCFSYPAKSTPDGDASLLRWTKEVFVEDTVNRKMGRLLLDHLAEYQRPVRCSDVRVINDTVASLLAGLTVSNADGHIGLIVGTGNNMAAVMEGARLPKLAREHDWQGPLPVNLESGNFHPPHLTEYDDRLDASSENPGHQRLEKAVSGVYLANLLKMTYPESTIDVKLGSKAVVESAYQAQNHESKTSRLARQILQRSAKLTAASLAGLIHVLQDSHKCRSVCIAAEGALFWGDPHYKTTVESTLPSLLEVLGLPQTSCSCVSVEHANLLGSAVAALSER